MPPDRRELSELGGMVAAQFTGPMADQVRRQLAKWRDPRAKLVRRRRKARRSLLVRSGLTGVFGVTTAALGAAYGVLDLPDMVTGGLTLLTAGAALSAGLRMRRLYALPLPEPVLPRPALPPPGSMAREPMQRLDAAEDAFRDLLAQLSGGNGQPAAVSDSAVTDAAGTARQAAATLRAVAAKLTAVERARNAAPPLHRGPLSEDIRRLRAELDEGVDGYGELVAAAGRAVAASASPEHTAPGHRLLLTDATQHLAGLARALGELGGAE